MKVMEIVKKIGETTTKYKPAILTGVAVAGVIATAVMVFKASPKCCDVLDEHKKKMDKIDKTDKKAVRAERVDVAKKVTKTMAAPALMGGLTIGCIVGSHSVSTRRIAVLSAAYSMSESALKDLNEKMTETLGEGKTRSIKDAIIKDKVKENKIDPGSPILMMGDGDCLCIDGYSGRPFRSNAQKIGQAINQVSSECRTSMYVSLNDFYEAINSRDLPAIPMGEDFGWNVDDLNTGTLPIHYTAVMNDVEQPCLYVEYDVRPRDDYRHLDY